MRRLVMIVILILAALPMALAARQSASPLDPDAVPILINARTDLELLANQLMGNERPVGWSGSLDINNAQLPLLIRLDLELLAGTALGADQRPSGWFGAVPSTTYAIARDIRHDVELLADTVGQPGVRPMGWAGGDPLMRCNRSVQTLVDLLERGGVFTLTLDVNRPDFCVLAEAQATQFAETNLLNTQSSSGAISGIVAADQTAEPGAAASVPGSIQVNGAAIAYLNRYARDNAGIIPVGTNLTPVARSYTQFSRMTLVRGEGFEGFVDFQATSLTEEQFSALPDVNGVPVNVSCTAAWCTKTINAAAPAAASPTADTGSGG